MIRSAFLATLLLTPLAGPSASVLVVAALAVPTAILSLDHALPAGACCTTYFPFVLIAAVLLRPIYAAITAIGSVGLSDAMFMGPRYELLETPMDQFAAIASLVSFALILGLVWLFRRVLAQRARPHVSIESTSGIIFSLEKGVAFASLPGARIPVTLGPEEEVAEMMRDFLAQLDVGKRLTHRQSRYGDRHL